MKGWEAAKSSFIDYRVKWLYFPRRTPDFRPTSIAITQVRINCFTQIAPESPHGDPAESHQAINVLTAHHVSNSNNSSAYETKPAKVAAKRYRL